MPAVLLYIPKKETSEQQECIVRQVQEGLIGSLTSLWPLMHNTLTVSPFVWTGALAVLGGGFLLQGQAELPAKV